MSATKCVMFVDTAMVRVSHTFYQPGVNRVWFDIFICIFLEYITMDITKHARDVVTIVEMASSVDEKLTPLKVCDAWMGKGPAKHRKTIKVTSLSRVEVESIIIHLLLHGYFRYFAF